MGRAAVEVELGRKSTSRLEAILTMYRRWIVEREIAGVAYICGTGARADSVSGTAGKVGLPPAAIKIELLDHVREEARHWRGRSAERSAGAGGA